MATAHSFRTVSWRTAAFSSFGGGSTAPNWSGSESIKGGCWAIGSNRCECDLATLGEPSSDEYARRAGEFSSDERLDWAAPWSIGLRRGFAGFTVLAGCIGSAFREMADMGLGAAAAPGYAGGPISERVALILSGRSCGMGLRCEGRGASPRGWYESS